MDATTGEVLLARNDEEHVIPASLTKLATALLLVKLKGDGLAERVTVTPEDLRGMADHTVMGLRAGDQVTYQDLLYGLMLVSGGDAAQCIARNIGDHQFGRTKKGLSGEKRFVEEMNQFARIIKLPNTKFANPFGASEPLHYSSARDLARLAALSFGNLEVRKVAGTAKYTAHVHGSNARDISMTNTSDVVEKAEMGFLASKTGLWRPGNYALASLWRSPKGRLISIVTTNSPDDRRRYVDTRLIVEHLKNR